MNADATQADTEQRVRRTGVWTLLVRTGEGRLIATSEWGTNYEFAEAEWQALPIGSLPNPEVTHAADSQK